MPNLKSTYYLICQGFFRFSALSTRVYACPHPNNCECTASTNSNATTDPSACCSKGSHGYVFKCSSTGKSIACMHANDTGDA